MVEIMAALEGLEDLIREKIEQDRWSHAQLSDFLKHSYPGVQGFSIRSIQRFCQEKNIHKTSRVTEQELDEAVSDAVSRVCSLLQYVKLIKLLIFPFYRLDQHMAVKQRQAYLNQKGCG